MESIRRIYIALVFPWWLASVAMADSLTNVQPMNLVTNLVEVLPYIHKFGKALELDLPEPLTTNHVTRFNRYKGVGLGVGVWIDNRFTFAFDVKNQFVVSFTDRKHAVNDLTAEAHQALRNTSKITGEEAVTIARDYLARMGYSETNAPVLMPRVTQARWERIGDEREPLPFYTVEWPWRDLPDRNYFVIEVDGIRRRINHFFTTYKSSAEESLHSEGLRKTTEK